MTATHPNGFVDHGGPDSPMDRLRERADNPHLLRGFGPFVVGVVLFILMVLLAPTVAPEHVVDRPITRPVPTTTNSTTP